jgi:hypothetical protein
MTGSTNGTRCGEVKGLSVTHHGNDFQGKVDTCAGPGDSGGPVYINGEARGLITSRDSVDVLPGFCSTYFQGLKGPTGAEAALHVSVRVR